MQVLRNTKKGLNNFGIIIDNRNNRDVTCYTDFKQQVEEDIFFFIFLRLICKKYVHLHLKFKGKLKYE
jgi:hypothetical protein